MTRTIAALLLASCVVGVVAAPAAKADRSQTTIFDASNDLLRAENVVGRDNVLDELRDLGVDTVRIVVPWREIVPDPGASQMPTGFDPTNPADYTGGVLASIDASIRGADERGMRVMLTPSSPIPDWASASGASSLADPVPDAYEKLLIGLGRRYDGTFGCPLPVCLPDLPLPPELGPIPRVDDWSLYNEPNQSLFLRPQRRGGEPYSPLLYRRLFLAGQRGLAETGHGNDTLLIGETAPSGGLDGVDPIPFLRGMLCLRPDYRRRAGCAPLRADGWAHHPYTPQQDAPYARPANPGLINLATIGSLTAALGKAARAGAIEGRLPIYVTEYGVESVPDADGVSLVRQAEYIGIAEYLMWRNPQIDSYGQYLLTDDRPSDEFSSQSGLITNGGVAKPSYAAFPIALVVRNRRRNVAIWGHVRLGEGARDVAIWARDQRGRVTALRPVKTDSDGYFQLTVPRGGATSWRAVCRLPGGRVLSGPFIHSYKF